jgi:hypothetical protein
VKAALFAVALATAAGCTILAPATTAGTILSHNAYTDSADRWSYSTPVSISVVLGLVFDIFVTRPILKSFKDAADSGAAVGDAFSRVVPR